MGAALLQAYVERTARFIMKVPSEILTITWKQPAPKQGFVEANCAPISFLPVIQNGIGAARWALFVCLRSS